ncbi:MAG: hypothetical protein Q8O67_08095 [Deltaproteobacteria bacterium]|nr:hypothetical protein [Deltaproteobacteria bacterium]
MSQNPPVLGPWKESGIFSPVIFVAPLVSFAVSLPLAALYALINIHIPIFGVVTIIALAAFAFGTGFSGGLVMASGRSRNSRLSVLLGFVGSLASLYSLWAFFLFFLMRSNEQEPDLLAIFFNPGAGWEVMNVVAENGWFTVKSSTPSGALLWILWGGEALIFIGVSLFSTAAAASVVWCEACSVDMPGGAVLEAVAGTGLGDIVKRGNPSGLDGVARDQGGMALERLTAHVCPTCRYSVASVAAVTKTIDKEGKVTETTKELLPKFVVANTMVERARHRSQASADAAG